ncbi:putative CPR-5 [Melia azedarach]|uniref:CPR-5 n=1 Tax=Melia azedarach TaxID=155640 RepID=A0ACC1XZ76_MELAZ|nr:putative CPR-5 [Melia azedarach]
MMELINGLRLLLYGCLGPPTRQKATVLERNNTGGDTLSVDHLSRICTSAVRESLTNVLGDKFDYFASNFEKSFRSTLRTLRLINDSSANKGGYCLNNQGLSTSEATSSDVGCTSPCGMGYYHRETELPSIPTQDLLSAPDDVQEQVSANFIGKELAMHGPNNQLACASSSTSGYMINHDMLSTMEKSVIQQVRSNDLKTVELSIAMKKLKLKETELALNLDSNHLERSKLAMGISKASFKAEKFKNELEETRHSELLRKCIDCLVAGIVVMSASLSYAAYVYSYRKISEATAACTPSIQESKSWWIPNTVTSFNSGLSTFKCQVQVISRMLFGFIMIITIAYLLIQRSASSRHAMPVTFILLLLGVACGFAGKLCVDTLGGSGYLWLLYWETLCFVHFFSNIHTSALFLILHGPVNITQGTKKGALIPYWIRRSLFYSSMLLFLPLFCGFMPFASIGEWRDHFTSLVLDYHSSTGD